VRCRRSTKFDQSREPFSPEFITRFTPESAGLRLACKQLYHEVHFDLQSCKHLTYNGLPQYLMHSYFWATVREIKVKQIESIVVVREPKFFKLDEFHIAWLLHTWPALRYFELQGEINCLPARYLDRLREEMPHADLEVCIKYDNNTSEWRFDCRKRTLVEIDGRALSWDEIGVLMVLLVVVGSGFELLSWLAALSTRLVSFVFLKIGWSQ
jgi:hypothetical protein